MIDRLYRLLLRFLPPDFDRVDREEMWDTYNARIERAHSIGTRHATLVRLLELKDLGVVVLAARWPFPGIDSIRQDIRVGGRTLLRTPLVSALAVASLALGIGATTALFSAVDVWLFRPITLPAAERLLAVGRANFESGRSSNTFTVRDYSDWTDLTESVALGIWRRQPANLAIMDDVRRVRTLSVSANLPDVLGITIVRGRSFGPDDARPGSERVALVSEGFVGSTSAAVDDMLGTTLILDGVSHTVVGVMHGDHVLPADPADIWQPVVVTGSEPRSGPGYRAVASRPPGIDVEAATSELQSVARRVATENPESIFPDVAVRPFREHVYSAELRSAAWVIGIAVCFVLLIACANIANLLLTRGLSRRHEVAVRGALGARRGRLVQQLLIESAMIACVGEFLGVGVAYVGLDLFLTYVLPPEVPGWSSMTLDGRMLAWAAGLTVASTLVFGLVPALSTSDVDLRSRLAEGKRDSGVGAAGRAMSAFVVAEIAASMVLLVLSGLLIRSVVEMRSVDLGIDLDDAVTFRIDVPATAQASEDGVVSFGARLAERLRDEPGIDEVAYSSGHILRLWTTVPYTVAGRSAADARNRTSAEHRSASVSYAEVLGLDMAAGRWFDPTDGPGVAVVSEALAALWWDAPNEAVGQSVTLSSDAELRIVGVVEDSRLRGPGQPPPPTIFEPFAQAGSRDILWLVRHNGAAESTVRRVREIVRETDPDLAVFSVMTGEEATADAMGEQLVGLRILGGLGALALVLTLVGVYGVVAHSVGRRMHEMGLRIALGARGEDLLRLVLAGSARTAAVGLGLGLLVSLVAGRGLAWLLFGVGPRDPWVVSGSATLMLIAIMVASVVPAWRASAADPVRVMRGD